MARTTTETPTTVRFYQLGLSSLEAAVTGLLTKAWERGIKSTLLVPNEGAMRHWDGLLWRKPDESFLPHGPATGPDPDRQPILLATTPDDRNGATLLVLASPQPLEKPAAFDKVIEFVDGRNPTALTASRQRYRRYREQGCHLEYWIQESGRGWYLKHKTEATDQPPIQ